ncbi:MAG: hypothetical protein ACYC63_13815 [Armatimonadota bacterium]
MRLRITLLFVLGLIAASAYAASLPPRDELGRSIKMTVLVDKVMQPEAKWTTEEWMLKETAEAGFNVYSPRHGFDDFAAVHRVSEWCEKYGLYHMPWMRGTLGAPAGAEADGKRLVWANGAEQALWSPNSDEFWAWTTKYIVEYARQSATDKALMGVFLDYENYAPGKQGNLYELSYDNLIMGQFAKAKGIEIPALEPAQRKAWLEEQKLSEEFEKFQVNHWRERCRALREAVDKLSPAFQFCIYPAPGTKFMLEAATPEWSTKAAPIILADPWTYGRSGKYMSHNAGLKQNRRIMEAGLKIAKTTGVPFIYIGGIDPVVTGADAEFSGKNALSLAEMTDGYWIFYEGPTYKTTHPEYFKWFTWANKAIAAKQFSKWQEPRETEDPSGLPRFQFAGAMALEGSFGTAVKYPALKLRGGNMLLVAGRKGTPVNVVVQYFQVGKVKSEIEYRITSSEFQTLAEGTLPPDKAGKISFNPPADGIYAVAVSAGGSAYSIVSADAPLAIYAKDGMSVIYGADRLYFHVPAGLDKFALRAKTMGAETIKLTVYDPQGKEIAAGETTPTKGEVEVTAAVGDQGGKTWSVSLSKAAEGVLEDASLRLDPKLPPTVSLTAEQVLRLK